MTSSPGSHALDLDHLRNCCRICGRLPEAKVHMTGSPDGSQTDHWACVDFAQTSPLDCPKCKERVVMRTSEIACPQCDAHWKLPKQRGIATFIPAKEPPMPDHTPVPQFDGEGMDYVNELEREIRAEARKAAFAEVDGYLAKRASVLRYDRDALLFRLFASMRREIAEMGEK